MPRGPLTTNYQPPTTNCPLDRPLLLDEHVPPSEVHREHVIELARLGRRLRLPFGRQAVRRVARGGEHVADAVRKPLAGVRDAARHRQREQVVERVRDLLVHRPLAVLELALDGKRLLRVVGDAEDVDAAVLADDRLADADLAIDLQRSPAEPARDVRRHEIRVVRSAQLERRPRQAWLELRHARLSHRGSESSRSGWPLAHAAAMSAGTRPSPNPRSRNAATRTASGFTSLPRKRRPRRAAAMPTLPDPMNGSATTSPALELCRIRTSATSAGFSAG